MGGGGAMRTVAKFATAAGIRGVPSVQRPSPASTWDDVDDWEFADTSENIDVGTPRVVMDGVPTLHEANEATTELKHAIEKMYLSSNSSECDGCSLNGQVSVMSPSHSDSENKSRVIDANSNTSAENRALQAFQLLSESPQAQSVVASIASDPNIWNAIVQNPALQDFFQSQHTVKAIWDVTPDFAAERSVDQRMRDLPYSDSVYAFMDSLNVLQNVKFSVAEMVNNVSNYLQNMFGFLTGETSSTVFDARGNDKANLMDHITMGGTFMGLAVLVVMVIMLKRS